MLAAGDRDWKLKDQLGASEQSQPGKMAGGLTQG